ncbi:hypothetical protein D9757_014056 [Collybiopsis confluens]|uniref:GP-PDE domain-containing protein n=1 Tax=Collybiopsis confluens TaxID=2823264 RepID=A0A8H5FR75_9AGAR|nr:hypothetical protein D9757_014056 [Collybiopsis confluens]
MLSIFLLRFMALPVAICTPGQYPLQRVLGKYFDVQRERQHSREHTSSLCMVKLHSTQPKQANYKVHRALIDGATTLELDNGITKDGHVVVWHDKNIVAEKCQDTRPAFEEDPEFPYVGKYIANLTLAQLQTLDCGSKRQINLPLQSIYPGVRISTLGELFSFVECADPQYHIRWNIESKINPVHENQTRSPQDFVSKQHEIFVNSPYLPELRLEDIDSHEITLDRSIPTSALVDLETVSTSDNKTSPWLAGIRLDDFAGEMEIQIASAAHSIGADILSPADIASDPTLPDYIPFTNRSMVDYAHHLGMLVKPWTVNHLSIVEQMLDWNVDGLITDYPNIEECPHLVFKPNLTEHLKKRVLECLNQHLKKVTPLMGVSTV